MNVVFFICLLTQTFPNFNLHSLSTVLLSHLYHKSTQQIQQQSQVRVIEKAFFSCLLSHLTLPVSTMICAVFPLSSLYFFFPFKASFNVLRDTCILDERSSEVDCVLALNEWFTSWSSRGQLQ
jgi:hypothetical protein